MIEYCIVHCTATPEGRRVTKADLELWHIKQNGWSRVGYHDLIHLDGKLENLITWNTDTDIDKSEIANGALGYNTKSIHVCYVGGVGKDYRTKDTRTNEQKQSLETYLRYIKLRYPEIKILGHRDLNPQKACPSFSVRTFLQEIGLSANLAHDIDYSVI